MILKILLNDYDFFRNINYRHQGSLKHFRTFACRPNEPKYEPNPRGLSGFVAKKRRHQASTKKNCTKKSINPPNKKKIVFT